MPNPKEDKISGLEPALSTGKMSAVEQLHSDPRYAFLMEVVQNPELMRAALLLQHKYGMKNIFGFLRKDLVPPQIIAPVLKNTPDINNETHTLIDKSRTDGAAILIDLGGTRIFAYSEGHTDPDGNWFNRQKTSVVPNNYEITVSWRSEMYKLYGKPLLITSGGYDGAHEYCSGFSLDEYLDRLTSQEQLVQRPNKR